MKNLSILTTLLLFSYGTINGQNGVVTTGASISTSGGSISYTIGQIDYLHIDSEVGSIRAGIQQPFEITSVNRTELAYTIDVSLYPNPTSNSLFIKTSDIGEHRLNYLLVDGTGKLIKTGRLINSSQEVNLSMIGSGVYFISIYTDKELVQSFQFLKK